MGWQIVQNPETKGYQIFGSITDTFMLENEVTREELTEFWTWKFGQDGQGSFQRIMKELDDGKKPYYQFTMTWDEALMWHTHSMTHSHGSQCTDEEAKLHPETCVICSDISKDLERENNEKR